MELAEAKRMYRKLHSDLLAARHREASLRGMIDMLVELYPDAGERVNGRLGVGSNLVRSAKSSASVRSNSATVPKTSGPSRQEAIRSILGDHAWLTIKDLTARIVEKGWGPNSDEPEDAIRTICNRMVKRDLLVRKQNSQGVYEYGLPISDASTFAEASELFSTKEVK